MSSETLPSSNIRFSHFIPRCGPRNTVLKCQALDTSKFAVKKVDQKPIQFSGECFPVDAGEINKPLQTPETFIQKNKPIHKMHETFPECEVKQDFTLERSPLPQLKQDEVLWKIFGMCEIRNEVDPHPLKNRTVQNGKQKFTIEISNNKIENDKHIDDIEEAVPAFAAVCIMFYF